MVFYESQFVGGQVSGKGGNMITASNSERTVGDEKVKLAEVQECRIYQKASSFVLLNPKKLAYCLGDKFRLV